MQRFLDWMLWIATVINFRKIDRSECLVRLAAVTVLVSTFLSNHTAQAQVLDSDFVVPLYESSLSPPKVDSSDRESINDEGEATDEMNLNLVTKLLTVLYVDGSFGSDQTGAGTQDLPWATIQKAINSVTGTSEAMVEIRVASGTYTSIIDPVVTMHEYESIVGGYEPFTWFRDWKDNSTIIDGEGSHRCLIGANHTTLDGFIIKNGYADQGGGMVGVGPDSIVTNCEFTDNIATGSGGGMTNTTALPTMTNCSFIRNKADNGDGGAIYCAGASTIGNCTFTSNSAAANGAVAIIGVGDAVITDSIFTDNHGGVYASGLGVFGPVLGMTNCGFFANVGDLHGDLGGALVGQDAKLNITKCLFAANRAGNGASIGSSYNVDFVISDSTFLANRSENGGGGGIRLSAGSIRKWAIISNCMFAGNWGNTNGAIEILNVWTEVGNSTFAGNSQSYGPAVGGYNGTILTIGNSIFRNTGEDIWADETTLISVDYSDVQGGYSGNGNIDMDPQFVQHITGSWTGIWTNVVYNSTTNKTTFTNANANYQPNALVGMIFWINNTPYYVCENTETTITVYHDARTGIRNYELADYHIRGNSPCKDSGTNTDAPAMDIDGDARPYNGTVDIGADEYNPITSDSDRDGMNDVTDTDNDNDSLPNDWEVTYILDPFDETGIHGASGDPDGDQLSNIGEYQQGTNPRDPNDPPATRTPTVTHTGTPTNTSTSTSTDTITLTPTMTETPTITSSPTITSTPGPTATPTETPVGHVSPPTGLQALGGATSIFLTWNPNTESSLAGYNSYRDTRADGSFTNRINSALLTQPNYSDATASPGVVYFYKVTAVNTVGYESMMSQEASASLGTIEVWMPDVRGPSGTNVTLPINVTYATGITGNGMDIKVTYEPALLTPVEIQKTVLTQTFTFLDNISIANGQLNISGISSEGATITGEGHILDAVFHVADSAVMNATSNLAFIQVKMFNAMAQQISVDFSDTAMFTVATAYILGDVDGSGSIDSGDALIAQQIATGERIPTELELQAGDVNGDGMIDSADVTLILRLAVGLPINPVDSKKSLSALSMGRLPKSMDYQITVGDTNAQYGETITIPVTINTMQMVSGVDLTINFDSMVLQLIDVTKAALVQNSYLMDYRLTGASLHITIASSQAQISGSGVILNLRFRVIGNDPKSTQLPVAFLKLSGQYGQNLGWTNTVFGQGGLFDIQIPTGFEMDALKLYQ